MLQKEKTKKNYLLLIKIECEISFAYMAKTVLTLKSVHMIMMRKTQIINALMNIHLSIIMMSMLIRKMIHLKDLETMKI